MALGVKTKPAGYFEEGDLLYVKPAYQNETVTYAKADKSSELYKVLDAEGLIGVIFDEKVSSAETGTWLGVRTSAGKMVYIELDSSLLFSKANPEYNYQDSTTTTGTTKKTGSFNWSGLFEGITAISTAILDRISGNSQSSGTSESGVFQEQNGNQKLTIGEWITKNILLVVLLPLVIILIVVLLWKPKKKQEINQVPTLNPTKI